MPLCSNDRLFRAKLDDPFESSQFSCRILNERFCYCFLFYTHLPLAHLAHPFYRHRGPFCTSTNQPHQDDTFLYFIPPFSASFLFVLFYCNICHLRSLLLDSFPPNTLPCNHNCQLTHTHIHWNVTLKCEECRLGSFLLHYYLLLHNSTNGTLYCFIFQWPLGNS